MAAIPSSLAKSVIFVVGATGTGKSDLAIAIARRFDGEIVNSDAMQLYEGLDVITNKTPPQERLGVPHHLLGTIGLEEEPWTMHDYRRSALSTIRDIHARNKLPVVVGGTGYYVNSLLSRRTVGEDSEDRNDLNQEQLEQRYAILKEPTEVILAELKRVDPLMARKWHPRDRRKISRSLAIYLQTGRPASAIYAEQKSDGGKESRGSVRPVEGKEGSTKEEAPEIEPRQPLSQFRSLILWPVISTSSLEGTLDARVEKMVQHGLLDEVDVLRRRHRWFSETRGAVDMTKGIWVAIGFKEFLKYAELKEGGTASQQELHEAYAQAVESTKIATRQYATRQTRWIRRKLLPLTRELNLANRIFLLDASGRDSWPNKVEQPALDLVFRFIQGEPLPRAEEVVADSEALLRSDTDGVDESGMDPIEEHCTICNVTAVLMKDWRAHLNSRTHKRREKVRALGNTKEQWIRKQQLRASQAEPDAPAEGAVGS